MHRAFQITNTEASVLKRCARTILKGASTQSRPSLPDLDEWLSRKRIQHKHFKNKNRFRLLGQNQTQFNFFSVFFTTRRTFGKTAPFYDSFQLESLFAGYLRFSLGVGNWSKVLKRGEDVKEYNYLSYSALELFYKEDICRTGYTSFSCWWNSTQAFLP